MTTVSKKEKPKRIREAKAMMINRSIGGNIVIFLFLALASIFMLLPIVYTVVTAFKPMNEICHYPPRFWVKNPTTDNFATMAELAGEMWVPFERYLYNSIIVAVLGTVIYIFVASMAAYPLAKRKTKGMAIYYSVIVVAIMFRPEVTQIPLYIIMAKLGLINTYSSLILPVLAGSFGVFLMRQFMETIPDEIIESARIDGASEYRIFFRMIMPMVKPAWLTLVIFTFQSLWSTVDTTYIYNESMKTLTTVLQQIASAGIARAGAGAAVALVLMIPPVAVFIISQSSVMETMAHSGMKG